ncbi:MAG: HAD family hydrolase [Myxococcota bacterium]|nr:HAD family hydrolase [Myxococcota bacterium]
MSGLGVAKDGSAVFLDRDGVLLEHVRYLRRTDDVELIPAATAAVRALNQAGVAAVVVTNQSVVARGMCSEGELEEIHAVMRRKLQPARLAGVYYCPHLPPGPGEAARPPYRVECDCRKPSPGLLERASTELGIDLARSLMIGDSTSDVEAGRRAGAATALVRTGVAGRDARYDGAEHVFGDVGEAIRWWLAQRPK